MREEIKRKRHFYFAVIIVIAGVFFVSRCMPYRGVISPCSTSVDKVKFWSRYEFKKFVQTAIPMGSSPDCAKKVLIGQKMAFYYSENEGKTVKVVYTFVERDSSALLRPGYWISVGDDRRQFSGYYIANKLVEWSAL